MLQSFVGLPYVAHGREYTGCDCWGLIYLYYRDVLKTPVPSYSAEMEAREFRPRGIAPLVVAERDLHWKATETPRQGDVVLMRNGGHHNHVGIWLDGNKLLHSDGPGPSCIERLDALHIRKRIVGYYRLA